MVVLLNLGPALRFLLSTDGWEGTFNFLTVTTITIFFAAVFGVWMERIMEQSEERAALIAELEAQRAEVARLSAERGRSPSGSAWPGRSTTPWRRGSPASSC
nr:hypothetical protein GCM10020093_097750 [Planobispora longispora]